MPSDGMYARDEEISDYIGWLQDTYNWPKYIRTTTGKKGASITLEVPPGTLVYAVEEGQQEPPEGAEPVATSNIVRNFRIEG